MNGNDAAICRFGAGRLNRLHRAFRIEIAGVRKGSDPECIHRMRVASRRIRIALPLFASCFPEVQYRCWTKVFAAISRALGIARDTDVQILFLDRYLRDNPLNLREDRGIRRLRDFLEKRRRTSQDSVLSAIDDLTRKDILREISAAIKDTGREKEAAASLERSEGALAGLAAVSIGSAWEKFLAHGYSVQDPDDTAGHHALRIAAKRLRYTLEVFRPLFPDRLRPAIRGLKNLQDLLGEIHDCDVWLQILSDQVDDVRAIASLFNNRKTTREELSRRLVGEWEKTVEAFLKEYLSSKTGILPKRNGSGAWIQEKTKLNRQISGMSSGDEEHAQHVTDLALQLFDDLSDLHGYGEAERRILEYAGHHHDIGWAYGQKRHHIRSSRMILADASLPVTPRDREIIALIARYHRKRVPKRPPRIFSRLKKPKVIRRVLVLASLLRIADGLDYTHANRVTAVSCTIGPDTVTCSPVYDDDGRIERTRALKRADLFEETFGRRFLIP